VKKAVANKWLNGTTEAVGEIKHFYVSSARFYSLVKLNYYYNNLSNSNSLEKVFFR